MNIFHSTMAEIVFFLSSGPWVNGSMGCQELLSGFSAAPESKNPQKGERFRSFLEVQCRVKHGDFVDIFCFHMFN